MVGVVGTLEFSSVLFFVVVVHPARAPRRPSPPGVLIFAADGPRCGCFQALFTALARSRYRGG